MIRFILKFIVAPVIIFFIVFLCSIILVAINKQLVGLGAGIIFGFPVLVICWWGVRLSQWTYYKRGWVITAFTLTYLALGVGLFGLCFCLAVVLANSYDVLAGLAFLTGIIGGGLVIFVGLTLSIFNHSEIQYTFSPIKLNRIVQKIFPAQSKQKNVVIDPYPVQIMQKSELFKGEQAIPTAKSMNLATASPGYIYLVQAITPNTHYKIGLSKNPVKRIRKLGVQLPFPIEVLHLIPTNHTHRAEKKLHNRYSKKRVNGEWFELSETDVAEILSLTQLYISEVESVFPSRANTRKL